MSSSIGVSERLGDLLDHRIRLRMDGGAVQRVFAIANAQETGGLLKRLGADAGNFVELRPRAEAAMLIAIGDDVRARSVRSLRRRSAAASTRKC